MASKIQVSDQEISDAYNTFKEEYFQPEKRDIIQVSFADVAKPLKKPRHALLLAKTSSRSH